MDYKITNFISLKWIMYLFIYDIISNFENFYIIFLYASKKIVYLLMVNIMIQEADIWKVSKSLESLPLKLIL